MSEQVPNYILSPEVQDDKPQHSKFVGSTSVSASASKTIRTSVSPQVEDPSEASKLTEDNLKQLVHKALKKLQLITNLSAMDPDTILEIILPQILFDLHNYETLYEESRQISETMKSYVNHSSVIDQDIADIYIDIHNIYQKLERIDSIKLEKSKRQVLSKKVREAEQLQKNNRHFINNQMELNKPLDIAFSDPPEQVVESAEKRTFVSNMLTFKKSDYSIQLNREKIYFNEVEKALNLQDSDIKEEDTESRSKQNNSK